MALLFSPPDSIHPLCFLSFPVRVCECVRAHAHAVRLCVCTLCARASVCLVAHTCLFSYPSSPSIRTLSLQGVPSLFSDLELLYDHPGKVIAAHCSTKIVQYTLSPEA